MTQCEWSKNNLCQTLVVRGSITKPSCDGIHSACSPSRRLDLVDIRDWTPDSDNGKKERSNPMETIVSMSLAKRVTITAKLDLTTGATDYELKLTINTKPEDIHRLVRMLQASAPVELRFYSPQLVLVEEG